MNEDEMEQLKDRIDTVEQEVANVSRMLQEVLVKLGAKIENCTNCTHRMGECEDPFDDPAKKVFCRFWMDYHVPSHRCRQWTDEPQDDILDPASCP